MRKFEIGKRMASFSRGSAQFSLFWKLSTYKGKHSGLASGRGGGEGHGRAFGGGDGMGYDHGYGKQ